MDLTKNVPRSAKDKMIGLVSLKRAIDKATAHNDGKLGDYDYDCPHDKPLFVFIGTDGETFARKVKELDTDQAIGYWVQREGLAKKTPGDIERFNGERMHWHPEDEQKQQYFEGIREQIAPGRSDIVTWFDLLDLDEKRPVPAPTRL